MIIKAIINELVDRNHKYCTKHHDNLKNPPKFVIYVGMDTYAQMMNEITGCQQSYIVNVYYGNNLFGFPIYRTVDHEHWRIYRGE